MQSVRLPKHLADVAACAEYNRRIRDDSLSLDWAEVEGAEYDALAALLEGITLASPPDGLNLGEIPDALGTQVTLVLTSNAAIKPKRRSKRPSKPTLGVGVWRSSSASPSAGEAQDVGASAAKGEATPTKAVRRPGSVPPSLATYEVPASAAALRAELEQKVLAELLGPADGELEEIDDTRRVRPRDRYLVGLLAPRRTRVRREEIDTSASAGGPNDDDDGDDETGLTADTMFPSSIGLTFCIEVGAKLRVRASWGRYKRETSAASREQGKSKSVWKRSPMGGDLGPLELGEGAFGPLYPDLAQPAVVVQGIANRIAQGGRDVLVVSVFLVNLQDEPEKDADEAWVFQPELIVQGDPGQEPFVGRSLGAQIVDSLPSAEERAVAMLYRDRVEFAVGHGASVHAELSASDVARAREVRTCVVPRYELPQQEARRPPERGVPESEVEDPALNGLELDMKGLAEAVDLRPKLEPLVKAYEEWVDVQRRRIDDPASGLANHGDIARSSLQACQRALERLRGGIELVCSDAMAGRAFRFANRAMWLQRTHTVYADRRRRGEPCSLDEADVPKNRSWRTFQLAFVLLTLEGLTRFDHPDRSVDETAIADLLWFPTGGGKTEAYLGCTAYVLALRRLQGEVEGRSGQHGVAVLMRYTLRLLTIQQFQRAAALICACERLRREALDAGDASLGDEPFRLGLWVGSKTTPNYTDDADESLKRKKDVPTMGSAFAGTGSPVQLKSCPWCGQAIEPGRHMRIDSYAKGSGRTLVFCGDERGACPFSARQAPDEGIPVLVVDEEIYRRLPALLIATVDKFAQMPWKGQVQMLFGRVTGHCSRHGFRSPETDDSDKHPKVGALPAAKTVEFGPLRPPDLIIQDELHLISGPLGTLTGLYETAVDELCTWQVGGKLVRPKVIASTATVRRAREQVRALFARELAVFPPSGLDADDNFFALQRATSEVPGRLYLGICAPGRRLKAALIRVYVAFLTGAQALYDRYGQHADPYMSLVGYFTSLRELASTRRLVDDDVRNRTFFMKRTGLAKRSLGEPQELTSRLSATQIPDTLDHLEVPFDPLREARRKEEKGKGAKGRRPIDVLLATNMISVGVDVKRLGLMVCTGQPKTTAEYIQATSRVGRASPGLVCTLYNWSRPRDLSHYEAFEHYHATFYKHIEALSVTPFSPRALDRGLAGLLVSMVRQVGPALNENHNAAEASATRAELIDASRAICRRAAIVEGDPAVTAQVQQALEAKVDEWSARAKPKPGAARLGYKSAKANDAVPETEGLLRQAGVEAWQSFTCLNSLRDVEPTVTLVLDQGRFEEAPGEVEGGTT